MEYKCRHNSDTVRAVQYDGNFRCLDDFSIHEVGSFLTGKLDGRNYVKVPAENGGYSTCEIGDWVVRDNKGNYTVWVNTHFENTFFI